MDIDEYLKKKKALESKKEHLEAESKAEKKKSDAQKKIEIKRKREITHLNDEPHRNYSHRGSGGNDHIQWIFLGLAFFVALIIVGIFVLSKFMEPSTVKEDPSDEVEELQKKLDELEKALNGSETEEDTEETVVNGTEEENETTIEIGPEFDFFLIDEHSDSSSLGIFDASGKIAGNLIQIWSGSASTKIYNYRVQIENRERAGIICKLDKTVSIDEDQDGEVDDVTYDLDRYVLEMGIDDKEILKDSVTGVGKITVDYEGRCYFCTNDQCEGSGSDLGYFEDGETLHTSKLRIIINDVDLDNNETNSSS